MAVAPCAIASIPELSKSFTINQDGINYSLNIKKKDDSFTFIIYNPSLIINKKYIRNLSLKEIKELHQIFYGLNSCNEFYEYIKALLDNKKLIIKTIGENLFINFTVDYLLRQSFVEIELFLEKKNIEDIVKNLCIEIKDLKEEIKIIKDLKNENQKIKNEIKIIKEENKMLKDENEKLRNQINKINLYLFPIYINDSTIIKQNEFKFIRLYLKNIMNKEIKEIKKLYQATKDGGEPSNFHQKCDNIPNTLTLIKSSSNKRIGGFTSEAWETIMKGYKEDKNAFLFSIDKQTIYHIKQVELAIYCHKKQGPTFGGGHDIGIIGNPIKNLSKGSRL